MNSTSKKRKGSSDENNVVDRLSQLPDHILVQILSFLPIVDVVRTVLIRRFGSLWTLLPSLEFPYIKVLDNWPRVKIDPHQYTPCFANFLRNVLFFCKRVPMERFRLSFKKIQLHDDNYKSFDKEVTTWIRFAIERQVKALDIEICFHTDVSILPRFVFTSQFLVILKLGFLEINELGQVQMESLRKLSLSNVQIRDEIFNNIISGCPFLQELDLCFVRGLKELRFTAPNIQKLTLFSYIGLLDCPILKILSTSPMRTPAQVVDVSSIREVNIRCHYIRSDFEEYMKKFCNAEVFRYFHVPSWSTLKELNLPQTRWKHLHIQSRLYGDNFLGICNVL